MKVESNGNRGKNSFSHLFILLNRTSVEIRDETVKNKHPACVAQDGRAGWSRAAGGEEVVVVVVVLLVTNSDLRGALRTALTPYRLVRQVPAHDGQQGVQEHVQHGLHHHPHFLVH